MRLADVDAVEVATGGRPAEALMAALDSCVLEPGGLYHVSVEHDDQCPCVADVRSMQSCTCEVVRLVVRTRE